MMVLSPYGIINFTHFGSASVTYASEELKERDWKLEIINKQNGIVEYIQTGKLFHYCVVCELRFWSKYTAEAHCKSSEHKKNMAAELI